MIRGQCHKEFTAVTYDHKKLPAAITERSEQATTLAYFVTVVIYYCKKYLWYRSILTLANHLLNVLDDQGSNLQPTAVAVKPFTSVIYSWIEHASVFFFLPETYNLV
jgi:hypothetical protein